MTNNGTNGYVRWWHLVTAFIGIFAIFVTVSIAFGSYVINNSKEIENRIELNKDRFHT